MPGAGTVAARGGGRRGGLRVISVQDRISWGWQSSIPDPIHDSRGWLSVGLLDRRWARIGSDLLTHTPHRACPSAGQSLSSSLALASVGRAMPAAWRGAWASVGGQRHVRRHQEQVFVRAGSEHLASASGSHSDNRRAALSVYPDSWVIVNLKFPYFIPEHYYNVMVFCMTWIVVYLRLCRLLQSFAEFRQTTRAAQRQCSNALGTTDGTHGVGYESISLLLL